MRCLTTIVVNVVLCCLPVATGAQTEPADSVPRPVRSLPLSLRRVLHRAEELLDLRDGHLHHDTLFLARRSEGVRLRVALNSYGSSLNVKGVSDDDRFRSSLEADNKYTVGLSAHWRGLSAGLTLNPYRFSGKNKDFEFAVNAYGNRLGADVVYQTANTFEGDARMGSLSSAVSTGQVGQDMFIVNAYYVLNGRRFSYPAAFGQSWRQLRSCGSWMLGASLMWRDLDVADSFAWDGEAVELRTRCLAAGIGYGYNLVLPHGWLCHMSALPALVAYNRSRLTADGQRSTMDTEFPELIYTGRMSVTRNFSHYFMGLYSIVTVSDIGASNQVRVQNVKWQACLFFGMQL